jgi:DNA-binding IclR family transcriptional regulator
MADQAKALRAVLSSAAQPRSADDLTKAFKRAKAERVEELLETLVSLGQARRTGDGKYSA